MWRVQLLWPPAAQRRSFSPLPSAFSSPSQVRSKVRGKSANYLTRFLFWRDLVKKMLLSRTLSVMFFYYIAYSAGSVDNFLTEKKTFSHFIVKQRN